MALCTLKIPSAVEIARSKPNRSPPWQNCKLENDTNTCTHRSRVVVIHTHNGILACASLHDSPLSEETGSLVLPQWRRRDNLFSHKGGDRITCSLGRGLDNLFFPEEGDWITYSPIRQETGSLVLL